MIRKLVLALGATAVLGITALAPTSASAFGWKSHHWYHGYGLRIYAPVVDGPDCYFVKQPVKTKFGWRMRRVTVCD